MKLDPRQRTLLVSLLVVTFGVSSWVELNGLWVELPVIVQRLPEGWYLASHIVVLSQLGNLGPLLYSVVRKFFGSKKLEVPSIYVVLVTNTLSCFFLIFYWDHTVVVFGRERSVAFLGLTYVLAFMDCSSNLLYYPFLGRFKEIHIVPLMIGQGLSGMLPGLLALAQGVGGNPSCENQTDVTSGKSISVPVYPEPRFSPSIFFTMVTFTMVASTLAFILLRWLPLSRQEMVEEIPHNVDSPENRSGGEEEEEKGKVEMLEMNDVKEAVNGGCSSQDHCALGKASLAWILILQGLNCALSNGVLPSVQTFSTLPYDNLVYHLAVTLSSVANPAACFLTLSLAASSLSLLTKYTAVGCALGSYILAMAALSPDPPLKGVLTGHILIVLAWVLFVGLMAYLRASIAAVVRQRGGPKALFLYGAITQVGSTTGAILMFFVVNFTSAFTPYFPCSA